MESRCPGQYPDMCPTVCIGRLSSATDSPCAVRMRLQMSHLLDVCLNLLVKAFTGNLLVIICISRRLSSVLVLEDLRYLPMACRQLGSRMKKSVVFVDVIGSVWVYVSVGGGRASWYLLRMSSSHFFLFFHAFPWKTSSPSLVGGFPFGKFCFLHFSVVVCIAFSNSFRPPASLISVRTVLLHVRDFLLGAWSSSGSPFL